jgi:CheY-like chemotaxis protein/signal transduction histidine kinase
MKILLSIKSATFRGLILALFAITFYGGYKFYQLQLSWQSASLELNKIEDQYNEWIDWSTIKSTNSFSVKDLVDVKQSFDNRLQSSVNNLTLLVNSEDDFVDDLATKLYNALADYEAYLNDKSTKFEMYETISRQLNELKSSEKNFFNTTALSLLEIEQAFLQKADTTNTLRLYAQYDRIFKAIDNPRNFVSRQNLLENLSDLNKQLRSLSIHESAFSQTDNLFRQTLNSTRQHFLQQQSQLQVVLYTSVGIIISVLIIALYLSVKYTRSQYYEPINSMVQKLLDAEKGDNINEVEYLNTMIIPEELNMIRESLNKVIDKLNIQRDALSFLSLEDSGHISRVGFMAAAAREIRTPLNTLTNTINQLLDSEAIESEWSEDIKELHHASFLLLALINQVVDLNKLQEGTLRLVIKPSSLIEQIHTICAIYKTKFSGKGVEFRLILDESSIPEVVETDAVRLNQILLSLLQQAWRKTNRGSVTFEINCLKRFTNECRLQFQITDTGEGYEAEELELLNKKDPSIFEVDSLYTGILLSKELLKYFGASMSIDTEPELGTSVAFSMNFPIIHKLNSKTKSLLLTKMVNQVASAEKRILVVDDNTVNLKITARILQKDMYSCKLATNAAEALDIIRDGEKFDLILMDLDMPDMDGISCTEYIRNSDYVMAKTIPIVALTAASSEQIKEKAFMRGMNDYITKPFTPLELLNTVAKNIDLAKQFGHTA